MLNTCCVTAEAVAKSRKAARRAARSAERVVVTGCAAALNGAFDGLPENVTVLSQRSELIAAGRLGAGRGAVLHGRRPAPVRPHPRLSQDPGRMLVRLQLLRDTAGTGRQPQPLGGRGAEEARRRATQGHRELVLTGVNLGCFRDREAGLDLAGLLEAVAALDGVRAGAAVVDRGQPPQRPAAARRRGHARRARGTCTCRCSRAPTRVLRAMRRHYAAAGFLGKMHRARELVDGHQSDQRRDRRPPIGAGRRLRSARSTPSAPPASPGCTCSRTRRVPAPPTRVTIG